MRTLLWKDYRQNRAVIITTTTIVLLPYVILGLFRRAFGLEDGWIQYLRDASLGSLMLASVVVVFIGGNALASERTDRSAEFAASLPIPRRLSAASKVVLAVGVCLILWMSNFVISGVTSAHLRGGVNLNGLYEGLRLIGGTAVLGFGASWFFSAILKTPGASAAAGLGALGLAGLAVLFASERLHWAKPVIETWYAWSCFTVGGGGFVLGLVCYFRRVEP